MIVTITGYVTLDILKSIVENIREGGYWDSPTIYIPVDSFNDMLYTEEVRKSLVWMDPTQVGQGIMTLWGAHVHSYFPELYEEIN